MMSSAIQIAVLDDDPHDLQYLSEAAEKICQDFSFACTVCPYNSSVQLLHDLEAGASYNLLILDVLMDKLDGLALAAKLRDMGNQALIVFISSNREMALHGYEVSAIRFLAKPLDLNKLEEALRYAYSRIQAKKEILLPATDGQHRISYSDIQYVEAFERGTRFVMTDETLETKLKFSEAERMLPQSAFIKCHRAYIVNVALTKRIRPYEFSMKSGIIVPISRHRYNEVNRQFVEYLTN